MPLTLGLPEVVVDTMGDRVADPVTLGDFETEWDADTEAVPDAEGVTCGEPDAEAHAEMEKLSVLVTVTVSVGSADAEAPTVPVARPVEEGVEVSVRDAGGEGEPEEVPHTERVKEPVTVTVRLAAALEDTEGEGEAEREVITVGVGGALLVAELQGWGEVVPVALPEKVDVMDAVEEGVPLLAPVAVAGTVTVGAGLADAQAVVVPVAAEEGVALPVMEAPTVGVGTEDGLRTMDGLPVEDREPAPAPMAVEDAVPHCVGDAEGQKVTVPHTVTVGDAEPCPPPEEGEGDTEREMVPVGLPDTLKEVVSVPEEVIVAELQREGVVEGEIVPEVDWPGLPVGVPEVDTVGTAVPVRRGVAVEVMDMEGEGDSVPVLHAVADTEAHVDAEGEVEGEPVTEGEALRVPLKLPVWHGDAVEETVCVEEAAIVVEMVTLGEPDAEGQGDTLGVTAPLTVARAPLALTLALTLWEAEPQPDSEGEPLTVGLNTPLTVLWGVPVTTLEALAEGHKVGVWDAVGHAEGECGSDAVPLTVRVAGAVAVATPVGVEEGEVDTVEEGDAELAPVPVAQPLREGLGDSELDMEGESVPEGEKVEDTEAEGHAVGECVGASETDTVTLTVPQSVEATLAVADGEGVKVVEALLVCVTVGDRVADAEGEGVAEASAETVLATEGEGEVLWLIVTVTECEKAPVEECDGVEQKDPEADADTRAEAEGDPERVARAVAEGDAVEVTLWQVEMVCVGEVDAHAEGVCCPVPVPLWVPLALVLGEPVTDGALVSEGDTEDEPHVVPLREGVSVLVTQPEADAELRTLALEEGDPDSVPLGEAVGVGTMVCVGDVVADAEGVMEEELVPEWLTEGERVLRAEGVSPAVRVRVTVGEPENVGTADVLALRE